MSDPIIQHITKQIIQAAKQKAPSHNNDLVGAAYDIHTQVTLHMMDIFKRIRSEERTYIEPCDTECSS